MTTKKGDDFVVGVGLDTSALDKQVNSIFKKLEEQTKRLTAVENRLAVAKAKNNTLQMQEVGLAKRKLNLAKQIAAAESRGVTGLDKVKQMSGGDKLSVAKAELALKGKMFDFDKASTQQTLLRASAEKEAAKSRKVNVVRDPLGISERQKATLGSRINYEANREYNTSLPEFAAPISRAKDQLKKLNEQLQKASSVEQITSIRERFKDLNREIREAVQEQNKLNRQLSEGSVVGSKFSSSLKHMALQFASVYSVIEGAKMAYRVGRDFDAMRAGLLASSDSAEAAGENFKFLVATSKSLGTDVESGVRGFNRLGSAMKGAGFSPDDIKGVYKSAQEASVTYGLTADKSNLAMIALAQMASKGKISSEELTKQFGEHVPIVMEAAEMATGKAAKEVFKMMENGKLMSKDFLVPFSKALSTIVRRNGALEAATEKLIAQQHRLTNAMKLMADQVFQTGMSDTIGGMFGDIAEGAERSTPAVVSLSSSMSELFKAAWDGTKVSLSGLTELGLLMGDLTKQATGMEGSFSDYLGSKWDSWLEGWYDRYIKLIDLIESTKSFRLGLSVNAPSLTQTPTRASTSGSRGSATTNTITIGKIEVNSSKADSKDVARDVMDVFGAQVGLF